MTNRRKVEIEGMWCRVHDMKYNDSKHYKKKCIWCNKEFEPEEEISLLINNCSLFPNCLIHRKCVDILGGDENTIEILHENYMDHLQLMQEAKEKWPI